MNYSHINRIFLYQVRGAANPPPQYAPGAGPAVMAPSSQDVSATLPPAYNKSSQQIQPPTLTTTELQVIEFLISSTDFYVTLVFVLKMQLVIFPTWCILLNTVKHEVTVRTF